MEKVFLLIAACACLVLLAPGAVKAERPWEHPVIKAAGEVVSLPKAEVQPDSAISYKIVFDITKGKAAKGKLIPGLAKVARLINVFASAGVKPGKLALVLVIHGPATEAALAPAAYEKKHGFANPSLALIDQLKQVGVKLYVCGQGLKEHGIAHRDVNPQIEIALSALTVLPTYQLRGYAFLPF
ncbi:MAG: DsrE family protein [Desulfarculaceae bacterium]|nr:DsrE family protein [Desulfarculaceae bacterium]MCF8072824.1 DsrE family protein [Desulfarculaceae bacterium]MCF8100992.1 DsrE family protein [Desulfarculaceae bacterium]MCF8115621.1 DsrE family protein [Desulfarculaceae bacterium]